jgi:hypothetical protein
VSVNAKTLSAWTAIKYFQKLFQLYLAVKLISAGLLQTDSTRTYNSVFTLIFLINLMETNSYGKILRFANKVRYKVRNE